MDVQNALACLRAATRGLGHLKESQADLALSSIQSLLDRPCAAVGVQGRRRGGRRRRQPDGDDDAVQAGHRVRVRVKSLSRSDLGKKVDGPNSNRSKFDNDSHSHAFVLAC